MALTQPRLSPDNISSLHRLVYATYAKTKRNTVCLSGLLTFQNKSLTVINPNTGTGESSAVGHDCASPAPINGQAQ